MVYARDSKSRLARDGGSSPLSGTSRDILVIRNRERVFGTKTRTVFPASALCGSDEIPKFPPVYGNRFVLDFWVRADFLKKLLPF